MGARFKLTHRDMGPIQRYLGPLVPAETLIWQDPVPARSHDVVSGQTLRDLTFRIPDSGLSTAHLVSTALGVGVDIPGSDKRGGANGARVRLQPEREWEANNPEPLGRVLSTLESIQQQFNAAGTAKVSLADLIVLAGSVGVQQAAKAAGCAVEVPFAPGRTDATQEQTDAQSFASLSRKRTSSATTSARATGCPPSPAGGQGQPADAQRARDDCGGARSGVLGANSGGSSLGKLTETPRGLTNDIFANLLDLGTNRTAPAVIPETFDSRNDAGELV